MRKIIEAGLFSMLFFTPALANEFGFGIDFTNENDGLIIQNIMPNSAAEKAGLKTGQKIIKLNGKSINKLKPESLTNFNANYKSLKILTEDNMQYNLKKEDIALLELYNQVNETFNNDTKYIIDNYKTEKIVLKKAIGNKHVRYANAYFNYADAISIDNLKIYVELFKVTDENVKNALSQVNSITNANKYAELYSRIYKSNQNSAIYGNAFKYFLELAIYNEVNKDLIAKQISEFDNVQKQQYTKFVYNTRIAANLYYFSKSELSYYLIKHETNPNITDDWKNDLKIENEIYNEKYKELCSSLSKNKITFDKPGSLSNREQIKAGVAPKEKWVNDKQIVALAIDKGYNPEHKKTTAIKQTQNFKQAISTAPKTNLTATNYTNTTSDKYTLAENYANKALEYMQAGNYQNAINYATKSINIGYDKNKYDFVEWALTVYYTRGLSYQNVKNNSAAIADYTTYIQKASQIRKYYHDPQIELLLGNCYYLRAATKLDQIPLYRSKVDGKMVRYANMHNDMLDLFKDLEAAIKIYSNVDLPQAREKKALATELLNNLKASYYR